MQSRIGIVEAVPAGAASQPIEGPTAETLRPSTRLVARALVVIAVRAALLPLRYAANIAGDLASRLLRLYVHMFVQASTKAKCPACGVRARHEVRWSPLHKALLHVCGRCHAPWSEQPLVQADKWLCTVVVAEDDGSTTDGNGVRTTTVQTAQREPQIVYTPTGRSVPVLPGSRVGGNA